jgi:hypothetical protein
MANAAACLFINTRNCFAGIIIYLDKRNDLLTSIDVGSWLLIFEA